MTIVAITGDHPRHAYLVARLKESGLLRGWVREIREEFIPVPPANLSRDLEKLFSLHFARREEAEAEIFGDPDTSDIEYQPVTRARLNSAETIEFVQARRPRLVISYGCHKLSPEFRSEVGAVFWNVHGGLSPQYRGVITHFWPSYMLEPQMTGMTLHVTTEALDGGAIVHQTGATMHRGDGLHMLAARTVKSFSDSLGGLLASALDMERMPCGIDQKNSGKLWLSSDWRPDHLRLIYEVYGDRIVDHALDGQLARTEPKLISVLLNPKA